MCNDCFHKIKKKRKKHLYLLLEDITIGMYYFRVWKKGFCSEGYVREINFAKKTKVCVLIKPIYFVIVLRFKDRLILTLT